MSNLDAKDLMIIKILALNARTPITRISRELGISDVAVKKRIEKLERSGVITGYSIGVSPRKLGFNSVAYVCIDVDSDKLFNTASYLASKDYITFLALTSGDFKILAEVWAKDSNELSTVLSDISKAEGVRRLNPLILLDVIKERRPLLKML